MPSDAENPSSRMGPGEARAPGAAGDRPPPDKIDTGLVSLLILARFYGVPADGAQLRHLFGQSTKPFGDADLLRAATHLGFKAGEGLGGLPERSEEHTSELQSQSNLVCRLLLEKKKINTHLN